MKNPANWFTLYVRDLARAKAFYEAVFQIALEDLPVEGTDARYCKFPSDHDAPGCSGMLCHDPQQHPWQYRPAIFRLRRLRD